MNHIPFGASGANPPAPHKAKNTTHDEPARAVADEFICHPDPEVRARQVNAAWDIIGDLDAPKDAVLRACNIVIGLCTDPRRDTARDVLALLGDAE